MSATRPWQRRPAARGMAGQVLLLRVYRRLGAGIGRAFPQALRARRLGCPRRSQARASMMRLRVRRRGGAPRTRRSPARRRRQQVKAGLDALDRPEVVARLVGDGLLVARPGQAVSDGVGRGPRSVEYLLAGGRQAADRHVVVHEPVASGGQGLAVVEHAVLDHPGGRGWRPVARQAGHGRDGGHEVLPELLQ